MVLTTDKQTQVNSHLRITLLPRTENCCSYAHVLLSMPMPMKVREIATHSCLHRSDGDDHAKYLTMMSYAYDHAAVLLIFAAVCAYLCKLSAMT